MESFLRSADIRKTSQEILRLLQNPKSRRDHFVSFLNQMDYHNFQNFSLR